MRVVGHPDAATLHEGALAPAGDALRTDTIAGSIPVEPLALELLDHGLVCAPGQRFDLVVLPVFTDERPLARVLRPAVLALAGQAPGLRRLVRGVITRQLTGSGLPA